MVGMHVCGQHPPAPGRSSGRSQINQPAKMATTSTPVNAEPCCRCTGTEEADCCCRCACCVTGGCCNLPHGKISLFPAIILTLAFTASMITLMIPSFAYAKDYERSYYGVGLWGGSAIFPSKSIQIPSPDCPDEPAYPPYDDAVDDLQMPFGPCFPEYSVGWGGYEDDHRDDPYRKAAMSFALAATIVGLGVMVGLWPITCCAYGSRAKHVILSLTLVAFMSQLCTFLIFGTEYCNEVENGCTIGPGGATSLSAAIGWLLGAIGVVMISNSTPNMNEEVVAIDDGGLGVVETAVEAVPVTDEDKV